MLKDVSLSNVGPAPGMGFQAAPRLNLLTGDNGLGKTLLLDVIWWALTGSWPGDNPAYPRQQYAAGQTQASDEALYANLSATLCWRPRADLPTEQLAIDAVWIWDKHQWQRSWTFTPTPPKAPHRRDASDERVHHPPIVAIYARIDGSYATRDSYREGGGGSDEGALSLNATELWDGKRVPGQGRPRTLCRGLIEDWVSWQGTGAPEFEVLKRVLLALSEPGEPLVPGRPTRVRLDDRVDIPTLATPMGEVPVILASAGTRRILGLAYLLVWSWTEHLRSAALTQRRPTTDLVVLIDELELHLHPKWQRAIVPALLVAVERMESAIEVQVIASTHSPMVLTSVETLFDEARDRLIMLERSGAVVQVNALPFAKAGDVSSWLDSEVFGGVGARSREAELAISAAMEFMAGRISEAEGALQACEALLPASDAAPPTALVERIHGALTRTLPSHDPFWVQWVLTWDSREQDLRR